jgi:hypothetical protein
MTDGHGGTGSGSGGGGGGDDWDAFDWAAWGEAQAEGGHGGHGRLGDELSRLTEEGDDRRSEIDEDAPAVTGGAWVSQGGILRWEGDEHEEESGSIRAEAESRWAANDVDLPPGAPDTLRIRSTRAWLARQRQLEADAVGMLLLERRKLAGADSRSDDAQLGIATTESPLDLALVEHNAAMQEYERLLELLADVAAHSGPSRLLVELHLALTEQLAALASAPEAPAGFAARVLLAEVEGEEATEEERSMPTPRSSAEWQGQAEAVFAARKRVEFVSAPEPED